MSDVKPLDSATHSTPGEPAKSSRPGLYRYLATSQEPLPRFVRAVRNAVRSFGVPAPRVIVVPVLHIFLAVRSFYYFLLRVFICEPFFKAYCKQYGRGLRTDCYLHWVTGKGDIIVGDNVTLDGRVSITFAARFSDRPTLEIGDNTGIAHGCGFVIGKRITIGRNCSIAAGTTIADSNGHQARDSHQAPTDDEVRPVVIGDNVWIGRQCMIFPGVRIGTGSVISAGSVVRSHLPPYSVAAGNPAKVMFRIKKPASTNASDVG